MGFSWPGTGNLTPFIFVGLVPLMYMEYLLRTKSPGKSTLKVFAGAYLAFLIFNVITTWWIRYASLPGMFMAEIFNSLFMAIVFLLFHLAVKKIGEMPGYLSWIIFWLAFEWVHFNWELSWVWLTLGNVFAQKVQWIQWYEYTGVMGGSLWVLVVNVMSFYWLKKILVSNTSKRSVIIQGIGTLLAIALPMVFSSIIYSNYEEKENPVEVVVVQPNIDPYHEKFRGMAESDQIDLLVELAEPHLSASTNFMVCPETAFPMGYWEHELEHIYGVEKMRELLKNYPQLRIVTGLSTMRLYAPGEKISGTARSYNDGTDNYYDYYNTAMELEANKDIELYHKSKLVLGVEKMPFGSLLKPLEQLSINLGGASGSLGTEKEALNFKASLSGNSEQQVAPVICYESIYGEYITEYVKKGAELIFIITNDGWWEDTPGYRQHLAYARIRAIEVRRSIARSANTGISAFINQRGDVSQPTKWWTRLAIKETIHASDEMTFYTRNGDYLGRVAGFFSLLLLAWMVVRTLGKKNQRLT